MCFVAMLECSSLVSCCILDGLMLLIAELCHSCFACHLQTRIRFRWSLYRFRPKSTHLSSGTLGLPSWGLVHHFSSGARICIAYHILHIIHVLHHVACALQHGWLWFPLLVFLPWVEPRDEYVIEEPIESANEDQAFVNSENFAGKMTIPSKSLLSLLA